MLQLNFKEKLKDSIMLIATAFSIILALVGLCIGSVKQTIYYDVGLLRKSYTDVATFGDLGGAGSTATSRSGLAFAILGFIMLLVLAVILVLEISGKYEKLTKFKMYFSFTAIAFIVISFACVAAFAADLNSQIVELSSEYSIKVAPGAILFFVFGLIASICSLFFNRGIKFWVQPKPTQNLTSEQ